MKKLTRKQIGLFVGGLVVVVGIGGTFAYAQSAKQSKIEDSRQELVTATNEFKTLDKELAKLQDTEDKDYLAKNVTQEQLNNVERKYKEASIVTVDDSAVKEELTAYNKQLKTTEATLAKIKTAFETQTKINALYQKNDEKPALNGKDTNKDLAIGDDLSQDTFKQVKEKYYTENATSNYQKTINELLTSAEDQINQIKKATDEVKKLYSEDKVISTDNGLYDTAKAETEKIKNEKAKKSLSEQLDKVKELIDKKAKEEAEAKAAEEQKQAEQTTANQGKNENNTNGNTTTANNGTANNKANATAGNSPSTGSGSSTGGGSTGSGNAGSTGGGSTGAGSGGTTTAPAGTVGPFYSDEECFAYADSQGWMGYAAIIIDGAMYISPR